MRRTFGQAALLLLLLTTLLISSPPPQDPSNYGAYASDDEFHAQLVEHVYQQYLQYGEGKISDEKFLVAMMYLLNDEVARRLVNPDEKRHKYFSELSGMLDQIGQLKERLNSAGIRDLDTFVKDLESRIRVTLKSGEVDFNRKRVFEDALQMLYVSEEMIKLDRTEGASDLAQKISRSKAEIMAAFGEVSGSGGAYSGPPPTIYDLFVEWRLNEEVQYEKRLDDVKLIRVNLLKNSSADAILRMFDNQLRYAYTEFNFGDYDLAEMLLSDMIATYPDYGLLNLDDLYFYRAESRYALHQYMHARDSFNELAADYPGSSFLPQAYERLIQISYALREYSAAVEYGAEYLSVASPGEDSYYDAQFLIAMSNYQLGNFDRTVETLLTLPEDHDYYFISQYFIGNAYADNQLYDEAVRSYLGLLDQESLPQYLRSHGLYKMGILEYERQNYYSAIEYLSQIPASYSQYDKTLNALAWAHFEYARNNPDIAAQDFSHARYYANLLNEEFYASPYKMETNSLLAYMNQLENEPIDAINLYREVYETKVKRGAIESYVDQRDELSAAHLEAKTMREKALQANNLRAYAKADALVQHLDEELTNLAFMETSNTGLSALREVQSVTSQLNELDRLRLLAEEADNQEAVETIDSMQVRLAAVLEAFPDEVVDASTTFNLFDDFPVTKHVVDSQNERDMLAAQRQAVMDEMAELDRLISAVNDRIASAVNSQDFHKVALLEQKRGDLERLKKRHDNLLVALYELDSGTATYSDFNKWGDLGAFGIINVYFDQKQKMQSGLVRVADVLTRVNSQLDQRKEVIESKIRKIEAEIRLMTMKARLEERRRLRAERERAFRESYFDTRESETEEQ